MTSLPSTPHQRIAFQGELGAHSESACALLWPNGEPVPYRGNADVARAVERGDVDAGVLPVENTIAGAVTATDDALLASTTLFVVSETVIPIHHCVLAVPGTRLDDVRWVESHPVALAQCQEFFARHPSLQPRMGYDTGAAARDVAMSGDSTRAALASRGAAERYGLEVLAANIEDRHDNQTRFFGISRVPAQVPFGAPAKTTVAVTTDDVSGALLRVLEPLAVHDLTLTRLVARPTGEPWRYRFIFDMAHAGGESRVEHALAIVRNASRTLRVLGTYAVDPLESASTLVGTGAAGARGVTRGDGVVAIRGAIGVEEDTPRAIATATAALVSEMARRNNIRPVDLISAVFTATQDLTSQFPASAAREAGWQDVPLLCATELAVPGSLPRCIRVLVHVHRTEAAPVQHVYLGRAAALRPDIVMRHAT